MTWDPATLKYVQGKGPARDEFMHLRLDSMKRNALRFRPMLSSTLKYAANAQAAEKCRKVMALYNEAFGPMTFSERMKSITVRLLAVRENRRMKKDGVIMRQPPTNRTSYPDRSVKALSEDYLLEKTAIASRPEMEAVGQ